MLNYFEEIDVLVRQSVGAMRTNGDVTGRVGGEVWSSPTVDAVERGGERGIPTGRAVRGGGSW